MRCTAEGLDSTIDMLERMADVCVAGDAVELRRSAEKLRSGTATSDDSTWLRARLAPNRQYPRDKAYFTNKTSLVNNTITLKWFECYKWLVMVLPARTESSD